MIVHRRYIMVALCCVCFADVSGEVEINQSMWNGIRARRDSILKKAVAQNLSKDQMVALFLPVFKDAFERGVEERRKILGADKEHYSNCINTTECIRAKVVDIMKTNRLYASYNPQEIDVLDIARVDFSRYYQGTAPLFIIRSARSIDLLRRMFPAARAVMCFDPRSVLTQGELESFVGHELAHTTQSLLLGGQACFMYFAEIDADIKNLCTLGNDGLWRIRAQSAQLIHDCYGLLAQEDEYAVYKLTSDLEGIAYNDVSALCTAVLPVYRSTHPASWERIGYMNEVVTLMQDLGGAVSTEEFRAIIGVITTRLCIAMNFKVNVQFLQLVRLEEARSLSRIAAHMQIPTLGTRNLATRQEDMSMETVDASHYQCVCYALI